MPSAPPSAVWDRLVTRSEDETAAAGRRLAGRLDPGAVVLLFGELGMGKTAFVRGLAEGLGTSPDDVSSPTFTIVHEYRGRPTLYHVDLYRIGAGEVDDLALEDLQSPRTIVAVEWADRLPRPIPGAIEVSFEDLGGDLRRVSVRGGSRVTPRDSLALPS